MLTVEYLFYLVLYSFLHGAEVNWNMGSIGNQASIRTEHSTREVKPLL